MPIDTIINIESLEFLKKMFNDYKNGINDLNMIENDIEKLKN